MATCSKCSFVMDATRPVPARCPRCGTPVAAAAGGLGPPELDLDDLGVGAPPAFAGEGQPHTSTAGSTLFGMLPDESLESPLGSGDSDGISLGALDDNFGELDLPMPGPDGSVELDLPASSRPAAPVFAAPMSAAQFGSAPTRQATPAATPIATPVGPRGAPPGRTMGAPAAPPRPPASAPVRPAAAAPPRPPMNPPPPGGPIGGVPARPGPAPGGPQMATRQMPAAVGPHAGGPPPAVRPTGSAGAPLLAPMHPRPAVGTVPPPPMGVAPGDLPTPVHRSSAMTFKVPTIDLPTPSRPGGSGFRAPEPPPFQAVSGASPHGTDAGMISIGDLDLPGPVDSDLLAPAGMRDLPTPIGVDLPTPAGTTGLLTPAGPGLLRPTGPGMLTPAGLDVEPAHILPTPADQALSPADQSLSPADQSLSPADQSLSPAERRAAAADGPAPQPFGLDPALARRSPAPRDVATGGTRRPLLLAAGGVGLIALLGAGAWAAGIFDPPQDVPITTSTNPTAGKGTATTPAARGKAAVERSPEVLAALAADTPGSYVAAITAAEQAGDPVGQAEAALCMIHRFGPDAVRQGQVEAWLQPYASQPEPFVRRVVGLSLLGAGALPQAEAALTDDGSRARLYRGWLRLAQGRAADAAAEADVVLAAVPSDLAALALRHEARAHAKPDAEVAAVEASLAAHPGHLGLTVSAVRVGIAAGQLRKARAWLDSLGPSPEAGVGFDALRLRLRAQLEDAAGSAAKAARHYEAAAAIVPDDRSLGIARVRALAHAGRLAEAEPVIRGLVEAKPDDVDAVLLQTEILLESGKGDAALERITAVEAQWPGRADAAVLLGRVHAMRLQTAEAQLAFASAIARDPTNVDASIAEAQLMVRLDRLGDALAILDTARKRVAASGNAVREAEVLRAKATILAKADQATAALAALDQALAATPTDNAALLARGLMRLDIGQFDAGRSDLLAVYERTGAFVGLTAPLGRIYMREGAIDRLEALVGDGLDDPDADVETLIVGARLRLAQSNADDAKALLQRVLAVVPNDWEAHLLLAQALLDGFEFPEALAQIDRSSPSSPSAEKHLLRGKILEYNARHPEARPEYLKALQIDPALTEARFLYGRLAARGGEPKLGAEQLDLVVAETDRFPQAFLELGRARRDLGEGAGAIAMLGKAIALDPTLLEAQYLLGRAHFDANAMGRAADAFAAATMAEIRPAPDWYDEALLFLGRARAKEGKKQDAIAAFRRYLELAPAGDSGRADAERQIAALR